MKITMKKDNGLVLLESITIGDVFIRLESGSIYLKLENNHDKSMSKCFRLSSAPSILEFSNDMLVKEVEAELIITPVID